MTTHLSVYDEIAAFMAGMNPEKVVAFKPSPANQERLDFLLDKQKEQGLTQKQLLAPAAHKKFEAEFANQIWYRNSRPDRVTV